MNEFYVPGWIDSPIAVAEIVNFLPESDVSVTPIGETVDLPKHCYLWDAVRQVTGELLPPRDQGKVGSCVAFGTVRAIEYTMAAEILAGQPEAFIPLAPEPVYGGSRVEVGKRKLGGRDGSIGAWAAEFVKNWGLVPAQQIGSHDLTVYSQFRCRHWGQEGCPDDLEPAAKMHPVRSITRVTTWQQAKQALVNGYGIALCSSQGFAMKRNEWGEAKASGTWQHCMCLAGFHTLDNGRELGRIDNSWGSSAHTGPTGPGLPGPEGFYADSDVIAGMLAKGDCWVFATVEGFPRRQIPWLI